MNNPEQKRYCANDNNSYISVPIKVREDIYANRKL